MGNRNNNLQIRSGMTDDLIQTLPSFHEWTQALAYDSEKNQFASAGRDNSIRVWFNNDGILTAPFIIRTPSNIHSIAFNENREELVSANEDGNIYLWDRTNLTKIRTLSGHKARVYDIIYLDNQNLLVSAGGDGKINLWDTTTGQLIKNIGSHTEAIYDLALMPDGKSFLSAGGDGVIKSWSASTYELLKSFSTIDSVSLYAISLSSDGKIMIAGDEFGYIHWWAIDDTRIKTVHIPIKNFHVSGSGRIHSLAFHPSTQKFSSTSEDAVWRLWDGLSSNPLRSQSLLEDYTEPPLPPTPPTLNQDSAKQLAKLAFRGIQPVFNARILLEQPKTLEPYFLAGFLTATDVHCPEGGTFSYTLTDVDNDRLFATASDMFSATVDACEDTRYLMDGAYTLTLESTTRNQRMPVTPAQSVLDATLTQLKIGAGDEDNTLSGHLHFVDTEADPSQIAPSSVLQTSSTDLGIDLLNQGTILFSNLNSSLSEETITEVQQLDYQATLALNGNSNSGTYRLATPEKLILDPAAQYPAHGKLTINGLSGNNALMQITVTVLDVDKVKIETDKTGNGSIDYQETVNWSELTTPFGR